LLSVYQLHADIPILWVKIFPMLFLKKLPPFPKINLLRLSQLFFGLAIFSLPLKIRSLVFFGESYATGFFNEYLAFFIHASEIFLLLAFLTLGGVFIFEKKIELEIPPPKFLLPFLILLGASIAVVPFSESPILALLHFWRLLEFSLAAFFIVAKIFDFYAVLRILAVAIFLQAALACAQFFAGGELGFHVFGESFFTVDTFNIAKTVLPSGEVLVRGMGTLPHANILGGLAAVTLLLFATFPRKNILAYFASGVILAGMFFSFSRAALLAFFAGLTILLVFQFRRRIISAAAATVIFGILLIGFGSSFFTHLQSNSPGFSRLAQIGQAGQIASENISGVGWGNYTVTLAQNFPKLEFYQLQPVHNFFALKIVEESILVALAWLGIFGMLGWWSFRQKKFEALAVLTAIFLLANLDHYFATNFTAEAVLWLAFAFVVLEISEGKPEFKKSVLEEAD
jgi:hypothetical protein